MTALKKIVYILIILFPVSINAQDAEQYLGRAQYLQRSDLDSSNWYATQAYRTALESDQEDVAQNAQFLLGVNFQKVIPEVVVDHEWREISDSKDMEWVTPEYLDAKYAELTPILVQAFQELKSENDQFRSELIANKNFCTIGI